MKTIAQVQTRHSKAMRLVGFIHLLAHKLHAIADRHRYKCIRKCVHEADKATYRAAEEVQAAHKALELARAKQRVADNAYIRINAEAVNAGVGE